MLWIMFVSVGVAVALGLGEGLGAGAALADAVGFGAGAAVPLCAVCAATETAIKPVKAATAKMRRIVILSRQTDRAADAPRAASLSTARLADYEKRLTSAAAAAFTSAQVSSKSCSSP